MQTKYVAKSKPHFNEFKEDHPKESDEKNEQA
jgi:hypothetical protein